jgi:hypothetical protein
MQSIYATITSHDPHAADYPPAADVFAVGAPEA